jgi:hypothetical protein
MASNTVLASNFNTNKISFTQVKTLDFGGKQAYCNYDGGMFVMQTPSCSLPYGMSAFDKAGPVKYSVELSLRGYNDAGKMKPFFDAIQSLDDFMVEQGVKNSRAWFKADLSRDVVKAFYTPMIRFSKDKDGNPKPYPPTIKLSLRQKRDSQEFDIKCFDDKRQEYKGIPLEELLVKGAVATCLIQCTGVWFAGSKYGLSWKAVHMRMDSLPRSAGAFDFVDDGEEFTSKGSAVAAPVMVEDEEEEDEEEVAPTPTPVKKSVVAAVMAPTPAPAPATIDDEADDAEPIPVPKKSVTVVKKKVVVKKA